MNDTFPLSSSFFEGGVDLTLQLSRVKCYVGIGSKTKQNVLVRGEKDTEFLFLSTFTDKKLVSWLKEPKRVLLGWSYAMA